MLDFNSVETAWGIDFADYFSDDLQRLTGMQADGLVEIDARGIRVLSRGRLLIRNICMAFDLSLHNKAPETMLFSMTV